MKGKFVAWLLMVSLLVAACAAPAPSVSPSPVPSPTVTAQPAPPTRAPVENTPTRAPATATLAPPSPTLTSTPGSTAPGAPQSVTITAPDGAKLVATFYPAATPGAPGVLLLHMLGRSRADWDDFAVKLQAKGFAAMALDLRGHGQSGGTVDWPKSPDDVRAAWNALIRQPGVDKNRTTIVGASIGANLALILGAAEPGVKGVVLLSPGLDYRGLKTEAPMKAYGPRPILLVASKDDGYSADTIKQLDALAQGDRHKLILYDNAGHGTNMFAAQKDLADTLLAWLEQNVK